MSETDLRVRIAPENIVKGMTDLENLEAVIAVETEIAVRATVAAAVVMVVVAAEIAAAVAVATGVIEIAVLAVRVAAAVAMATTVAVIAMVAKAVETVVVMAAVAVTETVAHAVAVEAMGVVTVAKAADAILTDKITVVAVGTATIEIVNRFRVLNEVVQEWIARVRIVRNLRVMKVLRENGKMKDQHASITIAMIWVHVFLETMMKIDRS